MTKYWIATNNNKDVILIKAKSEAQAERKLIEYLDAETFAELVEMWKTEIQEITII